MSEQNELDALWKKWSKGDCAAKGKTTKSSSLNLANIYGLCYTFFVVIAVSGVILIGEILYESVMDMKRFKTVSSEMLRAYSKQSPLNYIIAFAPDCFRNQYFANIQSTDSNESKLFH